MTFTQFIILRVESWLSRTLWEPGLRFKIRVVGVQNNNGDRNVMVCFKRGE